MVRTSPHVLIRSGGPDDPWIWLKVTSLSSTSSVLKNGRIPIEISSFHSKKYFFKTTKEADSSH
jgi:hypothetical protein